jgi:hypothetical protein
VEFWCVEELKVPQPQFFHSASVTFLYSQVFCFIVSAVAQGVAYRRWHLLNAKDKMNGWHLYGWFSMLCCAGSIAGVFAYSTRIAQLSQNYPSRRMEMRLKNPTPAESLAIAEMRGYEIRFTAAHFVLFPVELGCVVVAELLVLHRVLAFSLSKSLRTRAWLLTGRALLTVVMLLNFVGFACNVASSFFFNQASEFGYQAGVAWAQNNSAAGSMYMQNLSAKASMAIRISSVQRFCEAFLLMIIVVAFLSVGIRSYRVIVTALRTLFSLKKRLADSHKDHPTNGSAALDQHCRLLAKAALQGKLLQRKLGLTFLLIFLTVLVRSVFSVMYGVSLAMQDYDNTCSPNPCNTCKNVYSHILFWILFTPEFQLVVMIIASPIAQLVALWGMSGTRVLEQMSAQRVQLDAVAVKLHTVNGKLLSSVSVLNGGKVLSSVNDSRSVASGDFRQH